MTTKRNAKSSATKNAIAQLRGEGILSNTHSPLLPLQLTNSKGSSIYQPQQGPPILPWTTRHVHTTARMSPPLMLAQALTKETQRTSTIRILRAPSSSCLLTPLLRLPYKFPALVPAHASIRTRVRSCSRRNSFRKSKEPSPELSEQQGDYHESTSDSTSQTPNTKSLSLGGQN